MEQETDKEKEKEKVEEKQELYDFSKLAYILLACWFVWYFQIIAKFIHFSRYFVKNSKKTLGHLILFDDFDSDPTDRFSYRDNMMVWWLITGGVIVLLGLMLG